MKLIQSKEKVKKQDMIEYLHKKINGMMDIRDIQRRCYDTINVLQGARLITLDNSGTVFSLMNDSSVPSPRNCPASNGGVVRREISHPRNKSNDSGRNDPGHQIL